jgi:hypothetical protein
MIKPENYFEAKTPFGDESDGVMRKKFESIEPSL